MWSLHSEEEFKAVVMPLVNTLLDEPCHIFTIANGLDVPLPFRKSDWQIKDFPIWGCKLWKQVAATCQTVRVMHVNAT